VGLSTAITRRPATHEDAAAVAALVVADETVLLGRPSQVTAIDILDEWNRVDLESGSWLLEEEGTLVGVGWSEARGHELGMFIGIVAQGAKGRGLGAALADLGESRVRAAGVARLHTWTFASDRAARELFEGRGYREVRRFYGMAIELTEPPREPALPDGLTIDVFDSSDARAFHAALGEAFEDHWEHHPIPFEQWWDEKQRAPGFDPTLWFVVRDGDELAATVRNDPDREGGGYVGALGVRRSWRGQGLGRALLLRTFAEFHRRGVSRVTLGVDADSPTGATRLYESVGMTVESETVVFEKALQ
jgi:mycothiol synthase